MAKTCFVVWTYIVKKLKKNSIYIFCNSIDKKKAEKGNLFQVVKGCKKMI